VHDPGDLWKLRVRSVDRARKAARRGDPEGLHDFRVALRRVGATAKALGARTVSREARVLVQSLSSDRQVEVDRLLLARIGKLGYLSPDATTALASRWEKLAERSSRRIARAADGKAVRALVKTMDRLARRERDDVVERLERARGKAEATLARSLEGKDDAELHRYRIAVKKARYLAEDLAALGVRRFTSSIEREKALQESLGRWNDVRMFCRRLAESRDEAEERGAIMLAAELEHLLAALEPTIASIRRAAVEASKAPQVVPIGRKRAGGRA
jgi:CHAD domain-containing protein